MLVLLPLKLNAVHIPSVATTIINVRVRSRKSSASAVTSIEHAATRYQRISVDLVCCLFHHNLRFDVHQRRPFLALAQFSLPSFWVVCVVSLFCFRHWVFAICHWTSSQAEFNLARWLDQYALLLFFLVALKFLRIF